MKWRYMDLGMFSFYVKSSSLGEVLFSSDIEPIHLFIVWLANGANFAATRITH